MCCDEEWVILLPRKTVVGLFTRKQKIVYFDHDASSCVDYPTASWRIRGKVIPLRIDVIDRPGALRSLLY